MGSLGPRRGMLGMAEVNGVAPLRGFNCSTGKPDNVRLEGSERLILPVSAIRFSHDRISEKFSCGRSILQMVLELDKYIQVFQYLEDLNRQTNRDLQDG